MNAPAGRRPWRLRLLLFLYGNGHLCGSALALLGPLLLFTGFIGPGWLPITIGLYAAGWLLAPRQAAPVPLPAEAPTDAAGTLARLDALLAQVRPQLPAEALQHLAGVRESVATLLPRLAADTPFAGALHTVQETVLRYLPDTLAHYLALPPAFRVSHPLHEGRTARTLLTEQLALLDARLAQIVADVAASDAQALLANGRFLAACLRPTEFLAP